MNKKFILGLLLGCFPVWLAANTINGVVLDSKTGEEMIGVTVVFKDKPDKGTITGIDGSFSMPNTQFPVTIMISFVGYEPQEVVVANSERLVIKLEETQMSLKGVEVTATRKTNSEVSVISSIKSTNLVMSGVSSQQIGKTQDRDASEVIKRIPGISIIDNRFIIARGLAQRYNNVWVNNNAVPSSEPDSRSFSFDMIPSGQIENMMIVKSPAPELPADFTGGFVKIATKSMADENSLQLSYGLNFNTATHFQDFQKAKGSATDFLGYDNGFRGLKGAIANSVRDETIIDEASKHGFNNDWSTRTVKPFADHRFSVMMNQFMKLKNGGRLGLVAAMNYSHSYTTYTDMINARFGTYNKVQDKPLYEYDYIDDQYSSSAKIGAMANIIWQMSGKHRFEFRNIFNQQGRDRYTSREGWREVGSPREEQNDEYNYSSRGTYTGQLSGIHTFSSTSNLDWTFGYSHANSNQPDRRQVKKYSDYYGKFRMESPERDFNHLTENAGSFGTNYSRTFSFGSFAPSLKAGAYAEYRTRTYKTRYFVFNYRTENLPSDYIYMDIVDAMKPEYLSMDKMHVADLTKNTNNYDGENLLACGYFGLNLPFGKFNVYAGFRYENNQMSLTNYVQDVTDRSEIHEYPQSDLFPSVNATYNINEKHLLRAAYGKSVNRPEFRELSPSTFYDFELFSFVKGNTELQSAYIHNFDLRYEIYPSVGEMISLAVFYKKFHNPIEWTISDNGSGNYQFSFENALMADGYGLELDVKKNLDFVGLPDWSLSFNGALIQSEVKFDKESMEHDRPMQGQSPFLINTGLFYQHEQWNLGVMYNIIGKRIVGIGKSESAHGGSIDNDIPDMYEMPRHALDLSVSYKIGKHWELSAGVRDILATPVQYKQFPKFVDDAGKKQEREQTTKFYKPGRNISITVKYTMNGKR